MNIKVEGFTSVVQERDALLAALKDVLPFAKAFHSMGATTSRLQGIATNNADKVIASIDTEKEVTA